MNHRRIFSFASAIYLIASVIAAYLVYDHYQILNGQDVNSFCNINGFFNCDLVNSSKYSSFLGWPVANWGLSYYLFGFLLCLLARQSQNRIREVGFILIPLSTIGVVTGLTLSYYSIFKIHAVCIFCSSLHLLNIVALFAVFWGSRKFITPIRGEFKKVNPTRVGLYGLTGAAIAGIVEIGASQLYLPLPFNLKTFIERYQESPVVSLETSNSPHLGTSGEHPLVQIVEFSDFECPFCARQSKELSRLMRVFPDELQVVFKNYPLDMSCNPDMPRPLHRSSCKAARAAYCAHKQKKFEVYHEKLFRNQHNLSEENFLKWGGESGISLPEFQACMQNEESSDAIRKDMSDAHNLGVNATPSFVINNHFITGVLITEEAIRYLIKNDPLTK